MSHSDLTSPRNIGIGAMTMPLLGIGFLAIVNTVSEPRSSAADVQAPMDPSQILIASMGDLTEAQRNAIAFHDRIPALGESDSPFPLIEEIKQEIGADSVPVESPAEQADLQQRFQLSAVMASKAGNIALINGKPYKVGATLVDGWVIQSIDPQSKLVEVKNSRGERQTIGLSGMQGRR